MTFDVGLKNVAYFLMNFLIVMVFILFLKLCLVLGLVDRIGCDDSDEVVHSS